MCKLSDKVHDAYKCKCYEKSKLDSIEIWKLHDLSCQCYHCQTGRTIASIQTQRIISEGGR